MDQETYTKVLAEAEACYEALDKTAEYLRTLQASHALEIFEYCGKATVHEEDMELQAAQKSVAMISGQCQILRQDLDQDPEFLKTYSNADFLFGYLQHTFDEFLALDLRTDFDRSIVVIENLANTLYDMINDYKAYGLKETLS